MNMFVTCQLRRSPVFSISLFFLATFLLSVFFASCDKDGTNDADGLKGEVTLTASDPLLKLLSAEESGIDFFNTIEESFENNITTNINIYNGGGVAVADINNDGLTDIYFISSTGENKLYQNLGGMKFKDITAAAAMGSEGGFETAVTAVDINADGFLDFYVCRAGPIEDENRRNRLFVNNGDLTFSEKAKEYGLDDLSASTGANFFDYDNDGDLDLYLLNYSTDFSWCSKIDPRQNPDGSAEPNLDPKLPYDSDRFYRNDGGKFKDVSKEVGIWNFAYGLSTSAADFNGDGWMDIYVGNDFVQPDFLYINVSNPKGGRMFDSQLGNYFRHTTQHTMGSEIADFDNDGLLDLHAVDMLATKQYRQKTTQNANSQSKYTSLIQYGYFEPVVRNVLQRNNGNGTFSDVGCLAGVYKTDWSWTGLLGDLDNDGWKDLTITNGYRREVSDLDFIEFTFPEVRDKNIPINQQFKDVYDFLNLIPTFKLTNFVFQNKGNWTFEDQSGKWATMKASWSNGAAYADFDNDGDLDYVVNNLEDPAFIYQNLAQDKALGNFLQFKLQGSPQNPFAVGASVAIYFGEQMQFLQVNPTRGIFSSGEHLLHFGLGKTAKIDKVWVRWPDGKAQTLTDVNANQKIVLKYADANETAPPINAHSPTLFNDKSASSGFDFKHIENQYNDFEAHFLQPWKISEQGPMMASGDVNGDGLKDVFIGSALDNPSGLYLQNASGKFSPASKETWKQDQAYEDAGAVFFDADLDGDQDLFVVSGAAEAASPAAWQNRLYLNDGKGDFQKVNAIPPSANAGSRAVAHDFDGDGDLDLFVGGRALIGNYPTTPKSYVLRNDRSHFVDATAEISPDFGQIGMVTDLAWANVDGDAALELVVVGEWMPLTVFKVANGKLTKMDAAILGFSQSNGLWNRLAIADLDKDGDMDLVTGNLGLNTRYIASEKTPLLCYANDFDKNGSIEPIMAFYEGDKIYPYVRKDVMVKQMPFLKKRFIFAKDYAKATLSDIFTQKTLDEGMTMKAFVLETCWWENKNGQFVRHNLPPQAQAAPVFGILVYDFNADGNADILLAGNKYGMEVETSRCDAGNGALLTGDGKGNFSWMDNKKSGFWATKEARDLVLLQNGSGKWSVIVSNNHDKAQIFGN